MTSQFLNDTVHPLTKTLHEAIAFGPDNYDALEGWKNQTKVGDDQIADLYAFIEDGWEPGVNPDLKSAKQAAFLSKCLWKSGVH